ncbi:MAG: ribosomal protein S18-alanine N-acetyltransferase [Enterococcus sp.]
MIYRKNDFAYATLAKQLWQISEEVYEAGSPWTVDQFVSDLEQDTVEYLVFVDNSRVVGFLGFSKVLDEAEITNIAISKSMQRQGLARLLLQTFLAEVKKDLVIQVFLEVRTSNVQAQELYRSARFRTLAIRKNYYQHPIEDAKIMSINLKGGK